MDNKSEVYTPVKSIDEEFERTNYALNAKGFTKEQLIRREADIRTMVKVYPNLTAGMAEMIWNYVEREGKDKIQQNIKDGIYDKKSTKYQNGGILKTGVIYDKDEQEKFEGEYLK